MSDRLLKTGFAILMGAAMSCSSGGGGGGGGGGGEGTGKAVEAGKKPAAVAQRTYTLYWRADVQEPAGGVKVTAEVPTAWKETLESMGPKWEVEGLGGFNGPSLVLVRADGDTPAAQLQSTIDKLGAEALAQAKRTDHPDGRVWMLHQKANGDVHARMYLPAPAVGGVVMCVIVLAAEHAGRLGELQRFCESARLVAG